MKKLLILGNGFDLAHGLQTKYSDFLEFCDFVMKIKKNNSNEENTKGNKYYSILFHINRKPKIKKMLSNYLDELEQYKIKKREDEPTNQYIDMIYNLISVNLWYDYFQKIYNPKQTKNENWIDFESEISYIIQVLDRNSLSLSHSVEYILDKINDDSIDFYDKFNPFTQLINNSNLDKVTMRDFRKRLFEDLKKFTEALEIYLSEFVLKQQIDVYSPDIRAIGPDYVINFNYTNIYSKIYYSSFPEFHIHGSCRNDVFVGKNNMVLGIDEYWSEQERDNHTNFTIFKKFAQRIQKRTGVEHSKIYEKFKNDKFERVCVYIFGHSLDVTDKDILKMFFDEDFEVTIFCRDEETEGEYIANVIKIIGEQKLIERVNQNPPTIIFKQQAPMISKASDTTFHPDCEQEEEPEDELVTAK